MQAIILAAGMGKRLKELTKENTKCMIRVNGVSLIERLLYMLEKKGLSKIIIVVGYKGEELQNYIMSLNISTRIIFINNPVYDQTNNIYSLSLADEYLVAEDTLLFESDLIFEESILEDLILDTRENLAVVDRYESWMDGTCMTIDEEDNIIDFISGKNILFSEKTHYYKTVNIYKFSKTFSQNTYVPFLEAYRKAMGQNEYYESVIRLIAMLGTNELKAKCLNNQKWYEIDDIQDLDIAQSIFVNNEKEHYEKLCHRYGGYWRYPKLLDFCYLVNPYFPPKRMIEEISANLSTLIQSYPSGMETNDLLASRNFNVKQDYIVVGNGAAEIISELMKCVDLGTVGIIRPTFEEYPNRLNVRKIVTFMSSKEDFSYTEDDLIDFFTENKINSLILINPDNPTGNYISYNGLIKLVNWAKDNCIKLIVDESFSDFADTNEPTTLINNDILEGYSKLFIVKSISKSYGVAGLRLGILVSSNKNIIRKIKRDISIWNINSIAEFYMQIYQKYEKQYIFSIEELKKSRGHMIQMLQTIPYFRVIKSQANFVSCELKNGMVAEELASQLLTRNIIIKCLTTKINNGKEYIRIAIRTDEENQILIDNLRLIGARNNE